MARFRRLPGGSAASRRRVKPVAVRLPLLFHVLVLVAAALAISAASGIALWWAFGRPSVDVGKRSTQSSPGPMSAPLAGTWTTQDTFDAMKIAFTVVAGVGGVVALTVAYRRQSIGETAEHREDTRLFTERFSNCAEQLGSDKSAVRLAGMYAMARLADDWVEERQTCIDVLCAYLRMPYDPPRDASAAGTDVGDNPGSARQPPEARGDVGPDAQAARQERQVRATAIHLIAAHLHASAEVSWQGNRFDFTGAVFDGGYFEQIQLASGTSMNFDAATFAGGVVTFRLASFDGGLLTMVGARITGSRISFKRAAFNGGGVYFGDIHLDGGQLEFNDASFAGGTVDFGDARITSGRMSFDHATVLPGSVVTFHGATFAGGEVDFDGVGFTGGEVKFHGTHFCGSSVRFHGATFTGASVDFRGAVVTVGKPDMKIHGQQTYEPATFAAGTIDFRGSEFAAGAIDLRGTRFTGAIVDLSRPALWQTPPRFDDWDTNAPHGLNLPSAENTPA